MNFLFPNFLYALAALAIPIIIHLFNFRRYKKVFFTNLKFLKEIQEETSSRSKLKHLLILLCRLLAVVFLVLAFAQPYVRNLPVALQNQYNVVSIYIDNSYTMEAKKDALSLLDIAKSKATELVNEYPNDTKFQIISNELEGKMQRLISKEDALARIIETATTQAVRQSSQVIARIDAAMDIENNAIKNAYYISDFQKNTIDVFDDTLMRIKLLPIKATQANNTFIDSMWLASPVQTLGEEIKIVCRLANIGAADATTRAITLKINDEVKANSTLLVPADGNATDTLTFNTSKQGWQKGELSIEDFPVTFDDTYFFTFNVNEQLNVTILDEGTGNKYLNTIFLADNSFKWRNITPTNIDLKTLDVNNIVILSNLSQVQAAVASGLVSYVNNGGSLFIFPKMGADVKSYNEMLQRLSTDLLGNWVATPDAVTSINTNEPEYENVFLKIDQNLDLPKVFGHYQFSGGFSNRSELLRLSSGQGLINKYKVGNGNVYLSAVPCNDIASTLPLNAVFVPLIHRSGTLAKAAVSPQFTIGVSRPISINNIQQKSEQPYVLKNQKGEWIPEQRIINQRLDINVGNSLTQAGCYDLQDYKSNVIATLGFNYNRAESQTTYLSNDEIKELILTNNIELFENDSKQIANIVAENSGGKKYWKHCLTLCLLLLGAELLLLRFWRG